MHSKRDSIPVSKHLPPDARDMLVKASKVQPTNADPHARDKAINQAVQRIQTQHPKLFR